MVLVGVHLAIALHIAHFEVSGRSLSPLEPSEAVQTLELGLVNAGFVLFAVAIVLTLLLGRWFCGWACHVVAYQDLSAWLLGKLGLQPRPIRSRLLVWVPTFAALSMFASPLFERWWQGRPGPSFVAHFQTDALWATFPGPGIALLTFLVDGFLVVYLLGAKGFCTYGCPYGAVFGAVDRFAIGRIRVTDACEGCGHCTATCTSNVDVRTEVRLHGMVVDPGCMKCGDCISVCPKQALYFGVGRPAVFRPATKARVRRSFDFSWKQEFALVACFACSLYAFRGLYGLVPFLLALGLSVLTAVLLLQAALILRRPDHRFQHFRLRSAGRPTPSGLAILGLATVVTGFVVHSAFVQYQRREGQRALEAWQQDPRTPAGAASLETAFQHLRRSRNLGLLDDPEVANCLAVVHNARGEWAEAELALRDAVRARPTVLRWRELATLCLRQGKLDEAAAALDALLALDPDNAEAMERRAALRARR